MEITKEKFIAYEKVRQSGVTNMWNVELVCKLSGLTRQECLEIMKNYSELNKAFPDVSITEYKWKINIHTGERLRSIAYDKVSNEMSMCIINHRW